MENTAAKIARLVGPPAPKAESKASPVSRSLDKELDMVSESKRSPYPETSLVFDQQGSKATPLATFTPEPSLTGVQSDNESSLLLM